MINISINKEQFSDLLNLHYGVFRPLKNFVNYKQLNSILISQKINNKFFPFPIFFGINKINFDRVKNKQYLKLFYKKNFLCLIKVKNIFKIDSNIIGKKNFWK